MTERFFGMREVTYKRRLTLRADARVEVEVLLLRVGKSKTAKQLREKFETTGALSKRDVKILRRLANGREEIAA